MGLFCKILLIFLSLPLSLQANPLKSLSGFSPERRFQKIKHMYLSEEWGRVSKKDLVSALIDLSRQFEEESYERGYLLCQSIVLLNSPMRRIVDREKIRNSLSELKPRLFSQEPFIKSFYYSVNGLIDYFAGIEVKSIEYYLKAQELLVGSELIPNNYYLAKSYDWNGDLEKAIKLSLRNFELIREYGYTAQFLYAYEQLADLYHSLEDYAKAIDYAFLALEEAEKRQDNNKIVSILNTIGRCKNSLDLYQEAIQYLEKAVKLLDREGVDEYLKIYTYFHLGIYNVGLQQYQIAETHTFKAIEIAEKNKFINEILSAKLSLVNIQYEDKNYQNALSILNQVSEIEDKHWDNISRGLYFKLKAQVHIALGNYGKAKTALDKAIPLNEKYSSGSNVIVVYRAAIDYYRAIKNYELAFKFAEKWAQKELELEREKNKKLLYARENKSLSLSNQLLERENQIKNGLTLFLIFLLILLVIVFTLIYTSVKKSKLLQAEKLNTEIRTQSLHTQMKPHFLFNTLNSIMYLIHDSNKEAHSAMMMLSDLYRYILKGSKSYTWPLKDEIELIKAYLNLQLLKYEGRLSYLIDCEDVDITLMRCPCLMIHTIVENSIKHAIAKNPNGGSIIVSMIPFHSGVKVKIADSGRGAERLNMKNKEEQEKGTGTGLTNTRKRLENMYGEKSDFKVNISPNGSEVEFWISGKAQTKDDLSLANLEE